MSEFKNPTIARAQRSAGTLCSALRPPSLGLPPAWADHTILGPHRHNGRAVGTTPICDHAWHHGPRSVPRPAGITLHTTWFPHHGRSSHAGITGMPHHGRSYHTLHHEHRHDGGARRAFRKPDSLDHIEKGNVDHVPRTPNGLPISCAATSRSGIRSSRCYVSKKLGSCGREAASTAWAGWAGAHYCPFGSEICGYARCQAAAIAVSTCSFSSSRRAASVKSYCCQNG